MEATALSPLPAVWMWRSAASSNDSPHTAAFPTAAELLSRPWSGGPSADYMVQETEQDALADADGVKLLCTWETEEEDDECLFSHTMM